MVESKKEKAEWYVTAREQFLLDNPNGPDENGNYVISSAYLEKKRREIENWARF